MPGRALHLGAAVAVRAGAARTLGTGRCRHPRQDDDVVAACLDTRGGGPRAGLPDRRRSEGLSGLGAARYVAPLRDRGRRVRHGVLRQALQVRALPPAHRDPQQSRVRSRRHLSGSRFDRDSIPPSGAHRSAPWKARRQCHRAVARACARARVAGASASRSVSPSGWHARAGRIEHAEGDRLRRWRGEQPAAGVCRWRWPARTTGPTRSPRSSPPDHSACRPAQAIEALARFGGVKRRIEDRGTAGGVTVVDDFAHHPTAIATTIEGLRARIAAESGSSGPKADRPAARIVAVIEPRSNTMQLGTMKALLAGQPAPRPIWSAATAAGWGGTAAERWRRSASARRSSRFDRPAGGVDRRRRRAAATDPGDEQRRFRWHPPAPARCRARGMNPAQPD